MDELLPYYNRELAFFRRLAGEFATAHPKVAGRLRLGTDASEDPHVERLIEAFALFNARTRHKLDDDFPEISDALLNVLHPHYLAPVPSMAIIQFGMDENQTDLTCTPVPRGTELETEPIQGEPCRFRTAYDVELWPFRLSEVELRGLPLKAPQTAHSARAAATLRLRLELFDAEARFADLNLNHVRFFLDGFSQYTNPLYELLFNNTLEIALATSASDRDPTVLKPDVVRPVGFEPNQGLLPYTPRTPHTYRLLTEYFTLPEKFRFFDLTGLQGKLDNCGSSLDIYFYLDRTSVDLEQNIDLETFRLGCTPMVNLYRQRAESIQTTQTGTEYRVVGDSRREQSTEIYSIDRVVASSPDGDDVECVPFYSVKHGGDLAHASIYWHASRRAGEAAADDTDEGTEVYVSLVELDASNWLDPNWYLDVETTCLNRDLPNRLPFGGGQPQLYFSEPGGSISEIRCLTPPSRTFRAPRKRAAMWRLISHLSLGHLSLVDGKEGASALREILKLYDVQDSPETREVIESIASISSRRATGRVSGGICRGTEVVVEFKPEQFSENGLFLFAQVLERFLGNYCSLNSFSQLAIKLQGRDELLCRWRPRSGARELL